MEKRMPDYCCDKDNKICFDCGACEYNKLVAYEDTGLEPSEVAALKAEVEKYKMLYEDYRKEHETCFDELFDEIELKDHRIAVLERAFKNFVLRELRKIYKLHSNADAEAVIAYELEQAEKEMEGR